MSERALTDIEAQRIRWFRDEYIRLATEHGVLFTSCNCCSGIGLVIQDEHWVEGLGSADDLCWIEGLGSGDDLLDPDTWEKVYRTCTTTEDLRAGRGRNGMREKGPQEQFREAYLELLEKFGISGWAMLTDKFGDYILAQGGAGGGWYELFISHHEPMGLDLIAGAAADEPVRGDREQRH